MALIRIAIIPIVLLVTLLCSSIGWSSDSTDGDREHAMDQQQLLDERIDEINADIVQLRESIDKLSHEQTIGDRLYETLSRRSQTVSRSPDAQNIFLVELASNRIQNALFQSQTAGYESLLIGYQATRDAFTEQRETLQAQKAQQNDELQRIEEAALAQREAEEALIEARAREEAELNQQLRMILARERELAEQILNVVTNENEQLRLLRDERRSRLQEFTTHRDQSLAQIDEILNTVDSREQQNAADKLLDQLRERRRHTRDHVRQVRQSMLKARDNVAEASNTLTRVQLEIENLRTRLSSTQNNELSERQKSLASLRLQLRERELQMATDIVNARKAAFDQALEEERFFSESIATIVPYLGSSAYNAFFSPMRDNNWRDAFDSILISSAHVIRAFEQRAEQFGSLSKKLLSVEFWSWILGLLMRLATVFIAIYISRKYSDSFIKYLINRLAHYGLFQNNLGIIIKLGDCLKAIFKPCLLYVALSLLLNYVASQFIEANYLRWIINALFIYWITIALVRVLFLPRHLQNNSSFLVGNNSEARTTKVDNLLNLEISRARKLIFSARIILIFALLSYYIPAAVLEFLGYNTIWFLVSKFSNWGLIAIIYIVLNQWKEEISTGFEHLAQDRMPRAVYVVKNHKNKIYGVLLIALASLYVITRELARFARAYLLDTTWIRRLNNFIFRKKIELQQREQDSSVSASSSQATSPIPDEYRQLFHDRPLTDEPYLIANNTHIDAILEAHNKWLSHKRRGTVAIVGEAGIGKTSLLNSVFNNWSSQSNNSLLYLEFTEKLHSSDHLIQFLCDIFVFDDQITTADDIIAALRNRPSTIMILDNCHLLFLRKIGGTDAFHKFLEIVKRTDDHHFWLLSFNSFAWSYLNRAQDSRHRFSTIIRLKGWSEKAIQDMILTRDALVDIPISFNELVVSRQGTNQGYEVVKTANGYFRLLHEYSKGNPRVAMTYWLRSLRYTSAHKLEVGLFRNPREIPFSTLSDNHRFALAAIAQHGQLNAQEIAAVINTTTNFCEVALHFFQESDMVIISQHDGRASITPLYFRPILKQLSDANFLYE